MPQIRDWCLKHGARTEIDDSGRGPEVELTCRFPDGGRIVAEGVPTTGYPVERIEVESGQGLGAMDIKKYESGTEIQTKRTSLYGDIRVSTVGDELTARVTGPGDREDGISVTF